MKYYIVKEKSSYELGIKVEEKIKTGWKPQGGVSFIFHGGFYETWTQAMVKE